MTPKPAPYAAVFTLNWLTASGTACFLATIAAAFVLRVSPRKFVATYVATFSFMLLGLMATGLDQVTAFSAVAASINNLGPGLGDRKSVV